MRTAVRAYWRVVSRIRRFLYGDRWPSPWFRQLRITRSISEFLNYAVNEIHPSGADVDPSPALPPADETLTRQPMMWSATRTYSNRRRKTHK